MTEKIDLDAFLRPETDLERLWLQDSAFREGLLWGIPRYGHPEGEIYKHIREVLDNIDKIDVDDDTRAKLRLVAFVHDTFKYMEDKSEPRDWSKHHAAYARHYAEAYTTDERLLNVIGLHDEAYYIWRMQGRKPEEAALRLTYLREAIAGYWQLYYLFFKADTRTGDKTQAPVRWFEQEVGGIDLVAF